jgi:zinc transport system substrate-binding protein
MVRMTLISLVVLLVSAGCRDGAAMNKSGKIQVITTLFPTYEFARAVGGDKVDVKLLLPPGQEAHTFDPSPQDLVGIGETDMLVYTGKNMEPWVEDVMGNMKRSARVVDTSADIKLTGGHNCGSCAHGHEHNHDSADPHIWLDFGHVQTMVDTIAAALVKRDQANKDFYLKNAATYKSKVAALDARTKAELAKCRHRTIISGGHFAFSYYARRYGLTHQSPYEGFAPDAEPSPQAIATLIDRLKESKINAIFYEEMLKPRVATVIAQETGVKLLLLHAGHNVTKEEMDQGKTFLGIMNENLERLKDGLGYSDAVD